MKKIVLISLWVPLFFTALAQDRLPSDKEIPIMAWSGIPAAETNLERFKELKEMGITINLANYPDAESMQKALDIARLIDMKMVSSCPELKSDWEKTVKKFMNHPALAGYFLKDEPIRKDFPELGEWAKKIVDLDTQHFCFVNLIASIHPTNTEALGTSSYADYVRTFAKEVPTQLLSYDFYPVLNDGVHERWYEGLEIFSAEAQKLNKPFWAFALASSYNDLHPEPTIPALRLQLFSNLAYGAQGLEYWSYWMSQGLRSAPIGLNGKRTVVYDRIKTVNKEIQNLAGVFVGSKIVSVKHNGTVIPRGTTRLSTLPWAIKVFETEGYGALVSTLENGENTFFVVLNRDLEKRMSLIIYGEESLKRVLKDGSIVKAGIYDSKTEIEPGDVAVYMFPTKK
ncbi:MAG: hypothetical protein JZU47_07315 [Prolixibacteraceae bacterium]|nr:hypothetical protein [Prolixibacteraceae bacterium]